MVTTVGETVHLDELVVAQFDEVAEGTIIESLFIEFNQTKYEEYLSSTSSYGKMSRKHRKFVRVSWPKQIVSLSGVIAGGSIPPKAIDAKDECQVPNSGELRQSGEPTYSDRPCSIGRVSKSSELGVLSVPDSPGEPCFVSKVPNFDESLESGEITYLGGLNNSGEVPNCCELCKSGELNSSSKVCQARLIALARPQVQTGGLHQARLTA